MKRIINHLTVFSLLFLDEAFSNLDISTETKLNNTLRQLKMTRIIITHRTEPLAFSDQVINVDPYVNITAVVDTAL